MLFKFQTFGYTGTYAGDQLFINTVATTRLLEKTENRKEVASGRLSK